MDARVKPAARRVAARRARSWRVLAIPLLGGSLVLSSGAFVVAGPPSAIPAAAPIVAFVGDEETIMTTQPLDPGAILELGLVLRVPGEADIGPFLGSLSDPASPQYRRFLTPAEFGMRFGLDDASLAAIEGWATDTGLDVTGIDGQRTVIHVRGSVALIESVFGVRLARATDTSGATRRFADRVATIPDAISSDVVAISGLTDLPPLEALQATGTGDAPGQTPEELRRAYGIDELAAAGLDGTAQTVAILSWDTFRDEDLAAWDAMTGTEGPPVERVVVRGPVPLGDGNGEVNLDIQTIRAIAPQTTILDFESFNGEGSATDGDMIKAVLADGRAQVISISWGRCEWLYEFADTVVANGGTGMSAEDFAFFKELAVSRQESDRAFKKSAFAAGVPVFVASGDDGGYGCRRMLGEDDLTVSVDYPSANPWVISVGGTLLWVREDGTYHHEAAWAGSLRGVGTGGGISRLFPRPERQQGISGVAASAGRLVPDVAGPADSDSGLITVFAQDGQQVTGAVGGTSFAAPFWAGVVSLIAQGATERGLASGGPPLGNLLETLYELAVARPESFHDITLGSNLISAAAPGWDAATGLGTPDVPRLAAAIWEGLGGATP